MTLPKPDWHQHRYPPAAVGVPLYDPDALLDLHPELVYSIRLASGLDDEAFERLYLQVARKYAHFVHVLPASRAHHHRNMGGMLRHGLEVASFALRRSDKLILGGHETPKQRFNDEAVWRFAMFVSAIGHDIGKVVADIQVYDHSGTLRWNPFEETLVEWGIRNALTTYHPEWSQRRVHRAHEAMSAVLLNRLLDPVHFAYLASGSREILMHVASTVAGIGNESNPLHAVITAADNASVSASLGSDTRVVDGVSVGISPAERFIETAARMVHDGWHVNQPGARVLVTNTACFLAWPAAFEDVKAQLAREGITGLFTLSDHIAALLIETKFAVPRSRTSGGVGLYYRLAPDFKGVNVKMEGTYLRLADISLLFPSAPPAGIDVEEIEEVAKENAKPGPAPAPAPSSMGESDYPEGEIPFSDPHEEPSAPAAPVPPKATPKPTAAATATVSPPAPASETPPAQPASSEASLPATQAREWLLRQRRATGQALLGLVDAVNNGDLAPGKAVFADKTDLLFSAAAAAKAMALEPPSLGELLDSNGILIVDPKRPTTRTVRHAPVGSGAQNCFRISAKPAAAMRQLIDRSILERIDGVISAPPSVAVPSVAVAPSAPQQAAAPQTPAAAKPKPSKPRTKAPLETPPPAPSPAPPAAKSSPRVQDREPAGSAPPPSADNKLLRDRIHLALNALGTSTTLPEGIVRIDNNLVGHREALVAYLKQQIPDVSGKEVYTMALAILKFAPTELLVEAGFSAKAKPFIYEVRS